MSVLREKFFPAHKRSVFVGSHIRRVDVPNLLLIASYGFDGKPSYFQELSAISLCAPTTTDETLTSTRVPWSQNLTNSYSVGVCLGNRAVTAIRAGKLDPFDAFWLSRFTAWWACAPEPTAACLGEVRSYIGVLSRMREVEHVR